jgi:hypothetical protein
MNRVVAQSIAALLLVSYMTLLGGCGREAAKKPSAPQSALGEIVGEETARLAGPGSKVLLLVPAKGDPAAMWVESAVPVFTATLARHGNVTVVAMERVKVRTDDPSPMREELTAKQFDSLLNNLRGAVAVVSFVGFPVLDEAQLASVKKRQLKMVAIYTAGPQAGPHYRKALESRALGLAILPRMEPPAGASQKPATAKELFNQQFQAVTPETAAQLSF